MRAPFDLGILGSGFGGSLLAMIARRLGLSVLMIDKARHPRFAIGESSTPLANLLLEELADRYDLPMVRPLSKWGTWQDACPEVACGLKRGFTFFHHQLGQPWSSDGHHEMLVAASPKDHVADTHWYRPDFDARLARAAHDMGVACLEGAVVEAVNTVAEGFRLSGKGDPGRFCHTVRSLADASGPRGVLFRQFQLGEDPYEDLPPTQALFGHFKGVRRWDALRNDATKPPYPVDDAAVHHLFEDGWIWVLRFNNGITSAGVASADPASYPFHEGESAWRKLLERLPSVRAQFDTATCVSPMQHMPRLAFRSRRVAGPGWALLPSAAGVVDPLLSTGFAMNLLGISRLARLLEIDRRLGDRTGDYERSTRVELDVTARLVSALYASMKDFELFAELTKLYFAAVTFTETVRRLGCPEKAGPWFLLAGHPEFRQGFQACCQSALQVARNPDPLARKRLLERVGTSIQPFDVVGLTRHAERRHYPARTEDLLASAPKLDAAPSDIRAMLERCGLAEPGGVRRKEVR